MTTSLSKYLLFAGHNYYPRGGVGDLVTSADTVEELQQYFVDHAYDIANDGSIDNWCDIVEHSTMKSVLKGKVESAGRYDVPGEPKWFEVKD